MRPLVVQMGVTIDGFVHGAKGYEDWGLPPEDDEVVAWKVASLREAGTHIMGRTTYESFAKIWPGHAHPWAGRLNAIQNYVFATTLDRADWNNSTIIRGDIATEEPQPRRRSELGSRFVTRSATSARATRRSRWCGSPSTPERLPLFTTI